VGGEQQFGDGAFDEEYLREVFEDPDTIAVLLLTSESAHVVGFSCAIPEGKLDPEREAESRETAHIVDTAIETSYQDMNQSPGTLMVMLSFQRPPRYQAGSFGWRLIMAPPGGTGACWY